jgi:small subunit ribosomal protein S3
MGQKVNPNSIRVLINKNWLSRWFSEGKDYVDALNEDLQIRRLIESTLNVKNAAISEISIERYAKKASITIKTARPGIIIGKKGSDIEKVKKKISSITNSEINLNIIEVKKPETNANIIANSIAQQIEKRVSYKRAMKKAIQSAMRMGCQGIRVCCSGRLSGAEIARTEWFKKGRIPLHTFRADIDYALAEANTTYGVIGIKVWVHNEEKK